MLASDLNELIDRLCFRRRGTVSDKSFQCYCGNVRRQEITYVRPIDAMTTQDRFSF